MFRSVTIAALAVLALALTLTGRAEAGASASAPSKYSRQQIANHQAARHFPITEYSSSSARHAVRCSTTAYC